MDLVGARLNDGVYDRSRIAAVLGGPLALDAEFSQCVDREERCLRTADATLVKGRLIAERIVVIDAVDQEDVRFLALAIHRERAERTARGARSGAGYEERQ